MANTTPQTNYSQAALDALIAAADQQRLQGANDAQILDHLTPSNDVWRGALRRYLSTGQRTLF